ncbi:uncharacterized protein L969DRAFT_84278 [Mixia osmundae IAM 14324]|uniref:Copper acquisition factor BIM1-like domain-containing protein n=1 Tax=Mixia osmundae (strain CBS 9802 / IAM 14324 / JCM 22182 / KY 12970) TaxID=764103 RepID=G7E2U4_MIXOS|nr:uncharacterized protein L969DRAFT_84278 [Mixia osmundae IAM 14324]KEI42422.1 hypothetical protein L969DRAFT_84278 [Mixia osmundae IAM 14324]GAA97288.1 hypothetical protein E5Q_03966 [Mixia osmundae IAM 14324]
MLRLHWSILIAFCVPALAHFTLDYPTARGFDEDIEPQFCGGFANVGSPSTTPGERQPFSLGQSVLNIDSHHNTAQVALTLSYAQAPTAFSDFNVSISPSFTLQGQGNWSFPVDLGTLSPAPVNGTNATIQIFFNGGDGALYQCSDVVLLSGFTTPSDVSTTNSTQTGTSDAPASSSSSTPSSGASLLMTGSLMTFTAVGASVLLLA